MKSRYLTKSRYKLGLECPNKLYFTKKENEFYSSKLDDPFLQALASGGFQVEELSRMHYPNGYLIEDADYDHYDYEQLAKDTEELLSQDQVVIFEAAFLYDGLFIRTDILVKKGNDIKLIEVKAKSFHPDNNEEFTNKSGKIKPSWKPYLFDVAFQKYVIEKSHPEYRVTPYLMLADKSKTTTINGLNQKFRVTKTTDKRTGIINKLERLENPSTESVMGTIDVSELISTIESSSERILKDYTFEESIEVLKDAYTKDYYFNFPINCSICKKCEFKADNESELNGLKSGFEYCWSKQLNWGKNQFCEPNIFEVWDFRSWSKIEDPDQIRLSCVSEDTIGGVTPKAGTMSRTERQWCQIEKSKNNDFNPELLKEELKDEMDLWAFPLNFIDFETSTVALPFFKGQKPYEQVAFQFSHHIYHEDGRIEHANEYLNAEPGEFPNFEFARALKKALSKNEGSVFKFATHENTIANAIIEQLKISDEHDKDELIEFLKSISHSKKNSTDSWKGERDMVDLCKVIKNYYYNPYTKGSNSIKKVLPAVFESSKLVNEKYSKPISDINVSSKNFEANKVWLIKTNDSIRDPYKSLPKIFKEFDDNFEKVSEMEDLADGGAALTAYGKLQYTDMPKEEREAIKDSLLRYCELDTLAMVMIYEHLNEVTN